MNGGLHSIIQAAKRLEGKVALITGGASGIGASTAKLFSNHGAKVVIADIQDDLGVSLGKKNQNLEFIHCDITQENDVKGAVDTAISKYGKLDILFANAGILGDGGGTEILASDKDDFKKVLNTNVYGAFLCAKHAAKVMIPEKKGSIIFTSSAISVISGSAPHAYAVSKHAVVGLMKNLCAELGQYGIRVNCVSPFTVATPMASSTFGIGQSDAEEMMYKAANLKGVVLKADDVADAALYLGSDESKYVSGLNLVVDGGYSTTTPATKFAMQEHFGQK